MLFRTIFLRHYHQHRDLVTTLLYHNNYDSLMYMLGEVNGCITKVVSNIISMWSADCVKNISNHVTDYNK